MRTISSKILALTVSVMTLTLALCLTTTSVLLSRAHQHEVNKTLDRAVRMFDIVEEFETFRLKKQVELMTKLTDIQSLIYLDDRVALTKLAKNYQESLNLPIFDVVDLNGSIIVQAGDRIEETGLPSDLGSGVGSALVDRGGRLALIAWGLIENPEPRCRIVIGTFLESNFFTRFVQLTGNEISMAVDEKGLPQDTGGVMTRHANLGDPQGKIVPVKIQSSQSVMKATEREIAITLLLMGVLIFGATFGVSIFLARSLSRPIVALKQTVEQIIETDDLSKRAFHGSKDEIGSLAASFNILLAELEKHQLEIRRYGENLERMVEERTHDLAETQEKVLEQQKMLIFAAKMSALGEMAGGMAHEINTPLGAILLRAEELEEDALSQAPEQLAASVVESSKFIAITVTRIAQIVRGLRVFARDTSKDPMELALLSMIVTDTLRLCSERFSASGVKVIVEEGIYGECTIECRPVEISQVLLNLLNNAFDAVESCENKWIRIEAKDWGEKIELAVTDSGPPIRDEVVAKLMQPFFTTKEVGKGTGLGLSISRGIVRSHKGDLILDRSSANTRFVISIPKSQLG